MTITAESIQEIVGTQFLTTGGFRGGAVKVDIAQLVNKNARGLTDDMKVDMLVEARKALTNAGHSATIRLQYQDRQGNWRTWPCIWVNPNQATSQAAEDRIAQLEGMVQRLLGAMGQQQSTDGDGVVTEEESPL